MERMPSSSTTHYLSRSAAARCGGPLGDNHEAFCDRRWALRHFRMGRWKRVDATSDTTAAGDQARNAIHTGIGRAGATPCEHFRVCGRTAYLPAAAHREHGALSSAHPAADLLLVRQ